VGDQLAKDVLPALDAGLMAVFIRRGPWGHLHAERCDAIRASLCIDSLAELPAALPRLWVTDCNAPR
jgi:FMN phosphatase YigB (HAD superfamily)